MQKFDGEDYRPALPVFFSSERANGGALPLSIAFTWSGGPRSSGIGFFCFSRSGGHKTKETYPTRPGSPTPCKQGLNS